MKRSFNLLLTLSTLAPAALAQAPTTEPPPPVPPADPAPIPAPAAPSPPGTSTAPAQEPTPSPGATSDARTETGAGDTTIQGDTTQRADIGATAAGTTETPAPTAEPSSAEPPDGTTEEPVIDPAAVPIADGYAPPPPPVLQQDDGAITLTPSGSMFTRYEIRENYQEIGASRGRFMEGDGVAARMRFGFRTSDIDLADGGHVSVQFTPQASGFWGLMPQQLADADLGLHEGFIHYVPGSAFALDIGRLVLNYGDALVIGNVDWHETGRSFDGARGRFTLAEGAWLDLIFTQLAEGRGGVDTDIGAGDTYFGGVYASIGPAIGIDAELDPYLLFNLAPATDVIGSEEGELIPRDSALQGTLGLRLKGAPGIIDYRAEAGVQFGSRATNPQDSVLAYQADVEVGVKVPAAKLRLALEGFYASGDDPTTEDNEGWDQLFPTAHKWLGLMDVIPTRSNIAGGVFHISYAGLQPVTLVGQAHLFASTADVPLMADEVLEAGYRGSEIDLGVVVGLGGNLKLRTLYGVFLPAAEGWADDRAAHFSETELRLDF